MSSSFKSNTHRIVISTCVRYPPVVCTTPLGLPVVPLVSSVYSGCSLSRRRAAHFALCAGINSSHQTSRPLRISTLLPTRLSTSTLWIDGHFFSASSTFCLSSTTCPRRHPPSAVVQTFASASLIRSASASDEKPPK